MSARTNGYFTMVINSIQSDIDSSGKASIAHSMPVVQPTEGKFVILCSNRNIPLPQDSHNHYQLLLWSGLKPFKIYQTLYEAGDNFSVAFISENSIARLRLYPLTWAGIKAAIKSCLPLAEKRLQPWLDTIERELGNDPGRYLYNSDDSEMHYDTFMNLREPVTKNQALYFLTSEMHVHQLYYDTLRNLHPDNLPERYLCSAKDFTMADCVELLPSQISVPEETIKTYSNLPGIVNGFLSKANGRVFGRICSTPTRQERPKNLSYVPGRKTAFVFGPETVQTLLLQKKPYEILLELGMLPEGIHEKCCIRKHVYWLILLCPGQCGSKLDFYEATWQGVVEAMKVIYPQAYDDLLIHLDEIKATNIETFEKQAQFRFIEVLPFRDSLNYMSYQRFCNLPHPRKAWQVRLLLYCELRLLELFAGDGHTKLEDGRIGEKEYLCRNYNLFDLSRNQYVILPLSIDIPDAVIKQFGQSE
ncbi:hypothetical protein TrispH2_005384 [Trichoplax sp. H2]|nr:hypothetical protein TrispH2_005384 [Trichoplax sp. H2]|eukprot:RDD43094.1 hypothetical protein TrispH2_005384 [Trichoplax sp. H2]